MPYAKILSIGAGTYVRIQHQLEGLGTNEINHVGCGVDDFNVCRSHHVLLKIGNKN